MKFFEIVCALVITSIYISEAMLHERSYKSYKPTKIDCHGRSSELRKATEEVICAPKPTLVPLKLDLDSVFYPKYAYVNRCTGYCPSKSCMQVKTNMVNVTVQQKNKHGYEYKQCYRVPVKEHTKCKCLCKVKENDCNIRQRYDKQNCECVCMKKDTCKGNMSWNEKSCECMCDKEQEICSTGLVWVPAMCKCAKIMMPSSYADDNIF